MFVRLGLAACLLLVPLSVPLHADHRGPCVANGCGPGGWRVKLVPDRFLRCSFKTPCDSHDVCYSQCMACGAKHDQNVCLPPGRPSLKRQCDVSLRSDIEGANSSGWYCNGFAWVYWFACDRLGDQYFGATNALRRFLSQPSPDELSTVKADLEAILDYTDFKQGEPSAVERLERLKEPLTALARNDRRLENHLVVKTEEGRKTLAFEAKRLPAPTVQTEGKRRFIERRFLNEIEITNMRVNQRPVSPDQILKDTPGVNPQNLKRSFKRQDVK